MQTSDEDRSVSPDPMTPGRQNPPPLYSSFSQETDSPGILSSWGHFFSLTGGCIFYCLSALSIIYGLVHIADPILAQSDVLLEKLACVAALDLYELAVLGVLTLIVLWRNVTDDAVSLVVLIPILLISNGIGIDMVIMENRTAGWPLGVFAFLLSAANLMVFKRWLAIPLPRLLCTGLTLLLLWNALMPAVLSSLVLQGVRASQTLRLAWQGGWLVMLLGGVFLLWETIRTDTGQACRDEEGNPFLRTPAMAWVFAGLLFLLATAHQYALRYVFDIRLGFGDFLPMIALSCLIGVELLRNHGKEWALEHSLLALVPLVAILLTSMTHAATEAFSFSLGVLWHPPVLLGCCALGFLAIRLRRPQPHLNYFICIYALGALMTALMQPKSATGTNWALFFSTIGATLLVLLLRFRNPYLALAAILVLGTGAGQSAWWIPFARTCNTEPLWLLGLFGGLGTVVIRIVFGRAFDNTLAFLGAALLALSLWGCFGDYPGWALPYAASLTATLLGLLLFLRAQDVAAPLCLCLPLLRLLYLSAREAAGWFFVLLSFVLLGIGAVVSLRKKRPD